MSESRSSMSRLLGVLVIAVVVALCAVVDQKISREPSAPANQGAFINAAPASAVSSAWYCPLVIATKSTPNAGSVVILNPNGVVLNGTLTWFPSSGGPVDVPVNVAPRSRAVLRPTEVLDAPYAAALVHFTGGGASVEQVTNIAQGDQATPCATTASRNWYFPNSTTEANTNTQIALFNPFTEDAIADATFVANDGAVEPQELQGLVVPARSLVMIDVGAHVRRRDALATTISVRSGRLSAAELQVGAINGVTGIGYMVGSPVGNTSWYAPNAALLDGRRERLNLMNPYGAESQVRVSVFGKDVKVDPYDIHVPANGVAQIQLDTEQRIPRNVRLSLTVESTNGVPVVAQRTVTLVPPSTNGGASYSLLNTEPTKTWLLAASGFKDTSFEGVFAFNPSDKDIQVVTTVIGDGNSATQPSVTVPAHGQYALALNDISPMAKASVQITSSEPVVVSREIATPPNSFSMSPAVGIR